MNKLAYMLYMLQKKRAGLWIKHRCVLAMRPTPELMTWQVFQHQRMLKCRKCQQHWHCVTPQLASSVSIVVQIYLLSKVASFTKASGKRPGFDQMHLHMMSRVG